MAPPDLLEVGGSGGKGGSACLGKLPSRLPRSTPAIPLLGLCGDLSTVRTLPSFFPSQPFLLANGELKIPFFFSLGEGAAISVALPRLCLWGEPPGDENSFEERDFEEEEEESSFLAL